MRALIGQPARGRRTQEPRATPQEIRQAYKQLMREFHPDRVASAQPEQQQQATELASLLNQIYEVRSASVRMPCSSLLGMGPGTGCSGPEQARPCPPAPRPRHA